MKRVKYFETHWRFGLSFDFHPGYCLAAPGGTILLCSALLCASTDFRADWIKLGQHVVRRPAATSCLQQAEKGVDVRRNHPLLWGRSLGRQAEKRTLTSVSSHHASVKSHGAPERIGQSERAEAQHVRRISESLRSLHGSMMTHVSSCSRPVSCFTGASLCVAAYGEKYLMGFHLQYLKWPAELKNKIIVSPVI